MHHSFNPTNAFLSLIVGLLVTTTLPTAIYAQADAPYEISCQVEKVVPNLTISKPDLLAAETIQDLNKHCKSEWVAEYISVRIATSHKGKIQVQTAKDNRLTAQQKENLLHIDNGSPVTVTMTYIPDNTLSQKEVKTFDFTVVVEPDNAASFPGGEAKLEAYLSDYQLKEKANGVVAQYLLSAVSFTVNEKGDVVDVKIAQTTENKALDQLLIKAACDMPRWTPATYADGTPTTQQLMISLGDRHSCMVNVLNLKRD